MPGGIIYAIYAAVFAVMQLAVLLGQAIGQFIALLAHLTYQRPKVMAVVYGLVVLSLVAQWHGVNVYHWARGQAFSFKSGVGPGTGLTTDPCQNARAAHPAAVYFSPDMKAMIQDAIDQQCWRLPAADVPKICPADVFEPSHRVDCIAQAERCYLDAMELMTGRRTTAVSTGTCLKNIAVIKRIQNRTTGEPTK